eukprot:scaffold333481_cov90-Attheya_sp.AAC.1
MSPCFVQYVAVPATGVLFYEKPAPDEMDASAHVNVLDAWITAASMSSRTGAGSAQDGNVCAVVAQHEDAEV